MQWEPTHCVCAHKILQRNSCPQYKIIIIPQIAKFLSLKYFHRRPFPKKINSLCNVLRPIIPILISNKSLATKIRLREKFTNEIIYW